MRRLVSIVAVVATFTTLSLLSAGPALADDPPTIDGPARVYPVENTTMNFTGTDPISGELRLISVDGTIEGNNCDDTKGNDYSPDDCPRIQMDVSTGDAGLLNIPGLAVKSDSPDGVDHIVAPSGAVVTNASNGVDPSELIDFNGTQAQLNDTLKTLQFIPATDYREKTFDDGQLPNLHTVVINGDGALQSDIDTQIKVEGPNQAPAVVVHQSPLTANIGKTADFVDDADVTDPELCTASICGLPYTNSTPIADPDSSMLLVAYLDPDCGTFNFLGAQFADNGSASNNDVDSLLLNSLLDDNQNNGYNSDQRSAIEATLDPAFVALDLTQETGSASQDTTVFAGIGDLDNVDYALSHIEYTAPATAKTCALHTDVSDLGNLGTPKQYVDSSNPTYEIPDALAATGDITFDVVDTHPHVTVEQTVPGPVPGVDPTHTDAQYTVTFDQPVGSFDGTDISTTGSDAGLSISCLPVMIVPNTTWTLSCTSDKDGKIKVSVPAGKVFAQGHDGESDYANADSTSSDNEITWDATDPTETIDADTDDGQTSPTSTSPIKYTVDFSEKTTALVPGTFDGSDIDLSQSTAGGNLVASVSGPNLPSTSKFTVTVTGMTTAGNVVASVKPNVVLDQALNPNDASTSTNNDNIIAWQPPATVTVEQAAGQQDPTSASPIVFTATFSDAVTGFDKSDVDLSQSTAGGTLQAAVTGGPTVYTIAVTGMAGSGTVVARIPAGAALDSLSNPTAASTSTDGSVTWNEPAGPPSVTVEQAAGQADPTDQSPVHFTATFSHAVTGFTAADVQFTGSTDPADLSAIVTGGPTAYDIAVADSGASGGLIEVSIPADAAVDSDSFGNLASTSTDNQVTYDTLDPDVTIEQAAGQADPTNGSSIAFTATFSEPVTNFINSDVDLTQATAGGTLQAQLSGGPTIWTITVTGMTSSGDVIVDLPANRVTDLAGNPNTASTSNDNTVAFDNTAPTVTTNQSAGQSDPANTAPIEFTVVFSEPVTGFTGTDVTLGGSAGPTTANVTGSGATYTVDVSGMTQSGTVTASVPAGAAQDAAGNQSAASTSTDNSVQFNKPVDTTPPDVTINQASTQADPTNQTPITFTVHFSEPVFGFTASDVSLGGTADPGTVVVSGPGPDYTVTVGGMTQNGTVTASIPAGAAQDVANNPNTASTSTDKTVTYDTTAPGVTINQAGGQADPTTHSPITFTVTFSEAVSGFTAGDVHLGGTAHAAHASVTGSGKTYAVAVSGMTASGSVWATVPAGAAHDPAGNASKASTSSDNNVHFTKSGSGGGGGSGDTTKPKVTVNQAAGQNDPTKSKAIAFTAKFSEKVFGFTASDVALTGTADPKHATISGSGPTYTITVTGMTHGGTVRATIPAGRVTDAAHNPNVASTTTNGVVTFNPTITLTSGGKHVSLSVKNGVLVSFKTVPPAVPPPPGEKFVAGPWQFSATCKAGTLVTFVLTLPSHPDVYAKLQQGKWRAFTWNGTTGARINGNVVTIVIRDNGRGDSNHTAGIVSDPGGLLRA